MGHSRDEKRASHERIVEIASRRLREAGTDGPGVADIMRAAGLTHGGFYKHFGSRDELVAEAVAHAFAESGAAIDEVVADADDPLARFVDWYASARHCANPGDGCAIVALGADAARAGDEVRRAYTAQVEAYLGRLADLIGAADEAEGRREAAVALSALVGAVLVARAVDDPALADELLADVRSFVRSRGRRDERA